MDPKRKRFALSESKKKYTESIGTNNQSFISNSSLDIREVDPLENPYVRTTPTEHYYLSIISSLHREVKQLSQIIEAKNKEIQQIKLENEKMKVGVKDTSLPVLNRSSLIVSKSQSMLKKNPLKSKLTNTFKNLKAKPNKL